MKSRESNAIECAIEDVGQREISITRNDATFYQDFMVDFKICGF